MTATRSVIFFKSKQPHAHINSPTRRACFCKHYLMLQHFYAFDVFFCLFWRPGQTADAEDNRKCVTMTTADVMSHWQRAGVGDFKPAAPRAKISLCLHSTFEPASAATVERDCWNCCAAVDHSMHSAHNSSRKLYMTDFTSARYLINAFDRREVMQWNATI